MYTYIYKYLYVFEYKHIYEYVYIHKVSDYSPTKEGKPIDIHVYMYIYTYIHMYLYVFEYKHIYEYVYIHKVSDYSPTKDWKPIDTVQFERNTGDLAKLKEQYLTLTGIYIYTTVYVYIKYGGIS
jgi:hypothetical protein